VTPRISKLQRWLDLIAFLVGRRLPVSVEEVMEGIPAYAEKWVEGSDTDRASTRRTFERDKDELRKAGIPIESVTYQINYGAEQAEGYALKRRDFYLPYLKLVTGGAQAATPKEPYALPEIQLSEGDADLALGALREVAALPAFPFAREARSAFRKLAFDLDPEALNEDRVIYVERPGTEEVLALVRPLSDALLARKTIRFRYHGIHRGEDTQREVRPYGLFFQHGSWYLVGHDLGRSDIRVFRVGRMEEIEVNGQAPNTPDFVVPEAFALDAYLQREAWELGDGEPLRARVLFRFPRSLWAERNRHGALVEERADGATVREFEVQQPGAFLRWLLSLEPDVEILAPEALASELQAMARAVAALYGAAV
jgi:proteasome accessory factor B